ncbi:BCCT family transporter, partial [Pseudoalteromonas agarivorans]|uniref:BCCT family transporter n=1 Tax=Pseudoalteromonas agarivorans TaxID=176102 RepID=UPI00311F6489
EMALGGTGFHWGLHAWAMYGMTALCLAYFGYNKGLPLSMRSVCYPLFGDRVWGKLGDVIEVMAVLVTLFGLATSL